MTEEKSPLIWKFKTGSTIKSPALNGLDKII